MRRRGKEMFNNHPAVRWVLLALSVLILIPLVTMLGMMLIGGLMGTSMMSQMDGMMDGMRHMSGAMMALCTAWLSLVAGALVLLIVLLARSISHA